MTNYSRYFRHRPGTGASERPCRRCSSPNPSLSTTTIHYPTDHEPPLPDTYILPNVTRLVNLVRAHEIEHVELPRYPRNSHLNRKSAHIPSRTPGVYALFTPTNMSVNLTDSTDAGTAKQYSGYGLEEFLASLAVSAAVAGVQIGLFLLLRNKLARIYKPKTFLVPERERT